MISLLYIMVILYNINFSIVKALENILFAHEITTSFSSSI